MLSVFDHLSFRLTHFRRREWGLIVTICGLVFLGWKTLRPASLFEWDEVLFTRALSFYDPAANSPHMPGYPLFVLMTRCVSFFVHDGVAALQLWSFCAAVASVLLLYRVGRQLGFSVRQATTSVLFFTAVPSFLWFSSIGLSDTTGVLFGGLILSSLLAEEKHSSAWLTGFLAACAVGVRTQELYLFPGLLWIACLEWKDRRIRRLVQAGTAFGIVSTFIWIPAILATGSRRWWAAFRWQLEWVQYERAQGLALPFAPISWIAEGWLVRPFGTLWLAVLFWFCVAVGGVLLWRHRNRRVVAYAAILGFSSLFISMFSLNLKNGPRYILTSLFFLSLLLGGLAGGEKRFRRLWLVAPLFFLFSVNWLWPGLMLRKSEPAPVMAVLSRIADQYDSKTTRVFYDEKIQPHAEWVLGRRGFKLFPLHEQSKILNSVATGTSASVAVFSRRGPIPQDASIKASWTSEQFRKLTPGRYLKCWAVPVKSQQP